MNHLRSERYRAEPVGLVIHAPRRYDLSIWLITRGREGPSAIASWTS